MSSPPNSTSVLPVPTPWLHRFALLTAIVTFGLIGVGGLVTSHEAGLAVPDWPNTYGYNMFLFPISKWMGGIFYEHSHRLLASLVGLLTTILAGWLWVRETRSCAICLFTGGWGQYTSRIPAGVRNLLLVTTLLMLGQLVLGATMRHQHAGLAIPDFPLAYGKLWPAMDAGSVSQYNQLRQEVIAANPITGFQIGLQMVHRMIAGLICVAVSFCAWTMRRQLGAGHLLSRLALVWLGMILLQALLGAGTIWSNKAADIATAHVLVGALSLAAGVMMSFIAFRGSVLARVPQKASVASGQLPEPFSPQTGAVLGGLK